MGKSNLLYITIMTKYLFSLGHSSAVAQPSSWVGSWEGASHTDGIVLDGSEESGWVLAGQASAPPGFLPVSCHLLLSHQWQMKLRSDRLLDHTDTSFSLNYVHSLISQTFTHNAGGPYPMIKQEQLSPRSSSSQPDNLSTQGAPHDSAAGRGGFLNTWETCYIFVIN